MNLNRVRLLGLTVVLFVLAAIPAFASNVRIVRLSLVQGDVQIDRNAGAGWEQAINNMPVIGGARIYAAENSKAELEFEDGSSVRLIGPAQITMLNLSARNDGSKVNQVQVDSGTVYVNARLSHHDDFRILAPTGETFAITRPSHLRFTVDEQTASLAMVNGEADVLDGARNAKVHSGETYNYVLGQPDSAARQEAVPPQPEDKWNQQRDNYNDQHASAGAQYSGSDDPNAAGVADLGYYGTYSDIPGYGEAWQPNGVGPDWDPYAYGAWSYYPTWGWTFVSGYPWGWAPFYYGNWCFINGRGWWWRPGPWHGHGVGGFHPQPRFTGSPGHNWNAPRPPASAARGTVAVAGSHLPVGPITATHSTIAGQHGSVDVTRAGGTSMGRPIGPSSATSGATSNVVRGTSALHPGLTRGSSPIVVGQKGSYALSGNTSRAGYNAGRNGYEIHRPPAGYTPPSGSASSQPHTYIPHGGGPPVSIQHGSAAPPISIQHGYSAPSVSSAPHVSSGVGAVSHSSGFSGGGGFSSGGSHGGGGGHR